MSLQNIDENLECEKRKALPVGWMQAFQSSEFRAGIQSIVANALAKALAV